MPRDNEPSAQNSVTSTDDIRQHFPALQRIHNGLPVAHFDGPGGTQVPNQVVEAMTDYLLNHNANTHWEYPTSHETDAIIDRARETFADFLNCSPDEIVFGQNMTSLTLHLSRALGRQFEAGDEIVVTELDHHANIDTWRALAEDRDLTIRVLPMDPATGTLRMEEFAGLINERTRLVAIGAASNALGTINDFEAMVETARRAGVLTFIDAVHFAAHELIDVRKIGCDFLACSAYKFYGPHIGVLYGRKELLDEIDSPRLQPAPQIAPEKFETGTQNHEGIAGAAAAVDFLASLGSAGSRRERLAEVFDELNYRQHAVFAKLWYGLAEIEDVRLYGPPPGERRTSTLSFTIDPHDTDAVARVLAEKGIFLSDGNFYAQTVVKRLGVNGLIRVGLACYSTEDEVDRLLAAIRALAAN